MNKPKSTVVSNPPLKSGQWTTKDSMTGIFLSAEMQEIANDPVKSAAFLKKAGIITKSGNLTTHYKNKKIA